MFLIKKIKVTIDNNWSSLILFSINAIFCLIVFFFLNIFFSFRLFMNIFSFLLLYSSTSWIFLSLSTFLPSSSPLTLSLSRLFYLSFQNWYWISVFFALHDFITPPHESTFLPKGGGDSDTPFGLTRKATPLPSQPQLSQMDRSHPLLIRPQIRGLTRVKEYKSSLTIPIISDIFFSFFFFLWTLFWFFFVQLKWILYRPVKFLNGQNPRFVAKDSCWRDCV